MTVIPGVIDFLFVRNIGAAFSMGEGHGIAFAVLALAVIVAIAVYLVRAPQLASQVIERGDGCGRCYRCARSSA